jgi:hypothetical protein
VTEAESIVVRGVRVDGVERALQNSPWRSINRFKGYSYLLVLLAPSAPILFLTRELDPGLGHIVVAAFLMLTPLLLLVWVQNATWRTYLAENAKTPSGAEADDWFIDAKGVRTSSPSLQFFAPWGGFADVRETPTVVHFILTPSLIWVLPKRCLGEESLAAIRRLVERARTQGDIKGIADRVENG